MPREETYVGDELCGLREGGGAAYAAAEEDGLAGYGALEGGEDELRCFGLGGGGVEGVEA